MRRLSVLALAAIFGGIALLGYGAVTGETQVHFVVIFPVITGTGLSSFAGMVLVIVGIVLGFLSMAGIPLRGLAAPEAPTSGPGPGAPPLQTPPAKKFGGVVFLGPFPVVFGSDARMTKYMLALAVVVTVLLLAFFFLVLFVKP